VHNFLVLQNQRFVEISDSKAIFSFFSQELLGPVFEGNWFLTTAVSSVVASVFVVLFMSPFDVVSTRIFNQPVDPVTKKGLYYKGTIHALGKIWKEEGSTAYLKVFRLN
jgi:hypothetical protein